MTQQIIESTGSILLYAVFRQTPKLNPNIKNNFIKSPGGIHNT